MIFHENHLPADDSHEISCLICYFWKSSKILNCRLLQIIGGALWVNAHAHQNIFVTKSHNAYLSGYPSHFKTMEHDIEAVLFWCHDATGRRLTLTYQHHCQWLPCPHFSSPLPPLKWNSEFPWCIDCRIPHIIHLEEKKRIVHECP